MSKKAEGFSLRFVLINTGNISRKVLSKVLRSFDKNFERLQEFYRKFVNVMPDIFDLYDQIEMEFADAYNSAGGRYGRKKYSGHKDDSTVGKSKFGMHDLKYKIPDGFMYPVVAAFRSYLQYNEETDKYEWRNGIRPEDIWNDCKKELTSSIMNFASSIGDNPNAVGKDTNIWDLAYMKVELAKRRE